MPPYREAKNPQLIQLSEQLQTNNWFENCTQNTVNIFVIFKQNQIHNTRSQNFSMLILNSSLQINRHYLIMALTQSHNISQNSSQYNMEYFTQNTEQLDIYFTQQILIKSFKKFSLNPYAHTINDNILN